MTRAREQHRVANTTTLDVCHNGDDPEEAKGETDALPVTSRHRQGLGSADHPPLPPTPPFRQPLFEAEPTKSSSSEAEGKNTSRREHSSLFFPLLPNATEAGEVPTPSQGKEGEALDTAGLTSDLMERIANPLNAKGSMTSDRRVGIDIGAPGTRAKVAERSGAESQSSSTSSTASVVDGLKGAELTRVQRRAAELSAAIESSQVRCAAQAMEGGSR